MDDVKSVDRNCVLKQDNTLWEWKENEDTKELVKIADDVKSMSSSIGFTLFIKQDNSLWGYGLCNYGELGQANANFVEEPVKIMNNGWCVGGGTRKGKNVAVSVHGKC